MTRRARSHYLLLFMPFLLLACQDNMTGVSSTDGTPFEPAFAKGSGLPFSEAMAELGDKIFDDERLSINRNQSCKSCHDAAWGFTGPHSNNNLHGAVYEGSITGRFGDRKPPSSSYSTPAPLLELTRQAGGTWVGGNFWDGRATGQKLGNPAADQAQGPFTNPMEQGLRDAACVVYRVRAASYAGDYRAMFGTAIDDIVFPENIDAECGLEGDAFDIEDAIRARIDAEYANIAIAIAVYEESHNLYSSKFDAAQKGAYKYTHEEQRGLALFQGKAKCARCHTSSGTNPLFTDFTYDNLGVPANPENPFYIDNPGFVDHGLGGFLARTAEWASDAEDELGKMKVPTLRNVDLRPNPGDVKAYMHNGVFKSLEEVVHFYNTRDVLPRCAPNTPRTQWGTACWPAPEVEKNMSTDEMGDLGLTASEEAAIVAFMKTLSDGYISGGRGKHFR